MRDLPRARQALIVILGVALSLASLGAAPAAKAAPAPVTGPASFPPGATWEAAFSPTGGGKDLVLRTIASARKTLLIVAYEFTDRDVAEAVEAAAHRGVKVRMVADYKAAQAKYSQVRILAAAGIPLRLDDAHPITHDKYLVIDGNVVETGSYNYSAAAAARNAENVLVLRGVPDLARAYAADFEVLWAESKPF